METRVARRALADLVGRAAQFVSTNKDLRPISCIKVSSKGSLRVQASNLTAHYTETIPYIAADADWTTLIDAKRFIGAVRGSKADDIVIGWTSNYAPLTVGPTTIADTLDPDDFPCISDTGTVLDQIDLRTDLFVEIMKTIIYAASKAVSRFNLGNIYFDLTNQTVVAADWHRLSRAPFFAGTGSHMVPAAEIGKLVRVLNTKFVRENPNISLYFSEKYLSVRCGPLELIVRLADGEYPDYKRVIPTTAKYSVRFERQDMIDALNSILPNVSKDQKRIELTFYDACNLSYSHKGVSDSVICPCSTIGTKFHVGLNAFYLRDALAAMDGSHVLIEMTKDDRPVVMQQGVNTHIIMPMIVR